MNPHTPPPINVQPAPMPGQEYPHPQSRLAQTMRDQANLERFSDEAWTPRTHSRGTVITLTGKPL